MVSITVIVDGKTTVISDIAPYVIERGAVLIQLDRIFASDTGREGALDAYEPTIVKLFNRYQQLDEWIARFENLTTCRANIEAGRALLRRVKGGSS